MSHDSSATTSQKHSDLPPSKLIELALARGEGTLSDTCLLYTSDAADE